MDDLLNKIAEENIFTNYKIEKTAASKKGDGFVIELLKFDLIGNEKTLNLIGKLAPGNKQYRQQIPVKLLYDNEIYFYEKVVRAFKNVQTKHTTKADLDLSIPKYYGSNKTEYEEVLFMENLLASNYVMWDHRLINYDHISLVLKEYGKFHAYSFANKEQDVNLWNELVSDIEDVPGIFFSKSNFTDSVLEKSENVVQVLRSRYKDQIADKLEQFNRETLKDVMNDSKRYMDEYSIITHGDSWCNNYMFQYEDKDTTEKPTAVKIIDFQIVRIGSPIIDISYLIYTCLQKEDLHNLDRYWKVYYSSLVDAGRELQCDINQAYPYEIFKRHWKKFSSYGLTMAFVVLHGMMSNKDEFPDFEEIFASGKGLFSSLNFISVNEEKYNDRIVDIVEHFVENDYL